MITTEEVGRRISAFTNYRIIDSEGKHYVYLPYYSFEDAVFYAPLPYHYQRDGVETYVGQLPGDFNMWLLRARDSGKISIVIPDGRSVVYLHRGNDQWDMHLPIPPGCKVSLSDDFHKLIMDVSTLHLS